MAEIQEIPDAEEKSADDDENDYDFNEIIKQARPAHLFSQRAADVPISVPSDSIPIKRRGRPKGSTNANSKTRSTTFAEQNTSQYMALGLILSSALVAKTFNDRKLLMTSGESTAAANAIVSVIFQYKQVREMAAMINPNNPWVIIAKGFQPYLYRVFIREMVENVIQSIFSPKQSATGQRPNIGRNSNGPTQSESIPVGNAASKSASNSTRNGNGKSADGRSNGNSPDANGIFSTGFVPNLSDSAIAGLNAD